MLYVGIIGYGFMGHCHKDMLSELDYAEVVGVYDIEAKQTEDIQEEIKVFDSLEELLSNSLINTVIIAVPNHLHLEMVKKSAEYGKDIICEKPAAMNVEEFDQMVEVTKEANVRFTIHHQRRWDKDYQTAKKVYKEQALGDVYTIKSTLYGFNGNMHDWHVFPEYGGGMLYDWGVHLIDQLLNLVDSEIVSVFADIKNVINKDVDDYFHIIIKFANGITGQLELGTYYLSTKEKWFERHWFIGGDKGSLNIDGFNIEGNITRTSQLLKNVPGKITMSYAGPTRSFGPPPEGRLVTEELPEVQTEHRMFFDNYYRAFQGKEELEIKPEQIRKVLKVMELARESAQTMKSVEY
ncbi:Gfo/Idh/MocA family protein [Bacillus sp. B1-b2]|uniref:Gfo/Idh/MocA family protein n=1 Tax=Bacillus sp. B1-b2 TaxID=2653201 RepID=UPI0012623950|nr:Gfo/Idh/MocA family oxidoreductase [Bacillus sp. B1-b2]KAB7668370.1 Gfo/Idh/MocA family oxidoreductase [Bacillus sp. B1-b2]